MKLRLNHRLASRFALAAALLLTACAQRGGNLGEISILSAPRGGGGGERLVVLMITDNTDHQHPNRGAGSITDGVTKNAEWMDAFFQRVRSATGMRVDVHKIAGTASAGDPFTCDNIVRTIKTLPVARGDAVMVYYAGHGFNIGAGDPGRAASQIARYAPSEFQDRPLTHFPFLACGTTVNATPNLDMIAAWLAEKKPRLTIVMADACNSFDSGSGSAPDPASIAGNRTLMEDLRLRGLFVEARGTVLMTSSQRGRFSYYGTGLFNPGGLFTRQFLNVLNAMPPGQPATWRDVGQRLTPMVVRVRNSMSGRGGTDVQTPLFHEGGPFATALGTR